MQKQNKLHNKTKSKIFLLVTLLTFAFNSFAQQNPSWANWSWLIGEWKGEGGGQPGQGGGTFSFQPDLDGKILVRKSHSEYPASSSRPAIVHTDLMIVSLDNGGNPTKAIYFDNEGHTINYTISYEPNTIILLSDKIQNTPFFRLTYSLLDNNEVNIRFEMSQDGEKFTTYIEGKSAKVK
jgi:hypothetical protein